jgi:hypothetical protein
MQEGENQTNQEHEELTRLVRDGVPKPHGMQESLKLTADKLTGRVPLGADSSNKTVRKALATGNELLGVFKFGFLGTALSLLGVLFIWAGFARGLNWQTLGVGVVVLSLGSWCSATAVKAFRRLQAVRRA